MTSAKPKRSEGEIFARLWGGSGFLTPAVAKKVLKLGFGPEDEARMRYLSARNREGTISPTEAAELDGFVKVGDLLAILHAQARRVVGTAARNGHG
jgi:hypothetical protein